MRIKLWRQQDTFISNEWHSNGTGCCCFCYYCWPSIDEWWIDLGMWHVESVEMNMRWLVLVSNRLDSSGIYMRVNVICGWDNQIEANVKRTWVALIIGWLPQWCLLIRLQLHIWCLLINWNSFFLLINAKSIKLIDEFESDLMIKNSKCSSKSRWLRIWFFFLEIVIENLESTVLDIFIRRFET